VFRIQGEAYSGHPAFDEAGPVLDLLRHAATLVTGLLAVGRFTAGSLLGMPG
jgi:hypothetical protein